MRSTSPRLPPLPADASFRRYFRLAGKDAEDAGTGTLIAVDAPPPEKCREFVQIAQLLSAAGVHVPRVLEVDFEPGFMLVTDLGTTSYLSALQPGQPPGRVDARRARRADPLAARVAPKTCCRRSTKPSCAARWS